MSTIKYSLISASLLLVISVYAQDNSYKYQGLSIAARVENLISQMTWKEKLAQTHSVHFDEEWRNDDVDLSDIEFLNLKKGIGQMGKPNRFFDKGPKESAEITNKYQRLIIEGNRFGIPAIFTRPVKELRGFQKIHPDPGESGEYELMTGASSEDIRLKEK